MNTRPTFQNTCLAALLLAGCCIAVAEPDTGSQAVPESPEAQAMAPVLPATAPTANGQFPPVASEPAPAASPAESAGNPVVASEGETQALAPSGPDDQMPAGETGIDTGTGSPDIQEAPAESVAAIDPGTLYGEWTVREQHPEAGEVVTLFSINSDSSFAGTMTVAGNVVWNYSGNWYLDGNLITWFYTQSTPPLMLVDETEVDEIILVDSEKLTYRSGKRDVLETLYRVN